MAISSLSGVFTKYYILVSIPADEITGVIGVVTAVLGAVKFPFKERFNDSGPFCGGSVQLPKPSSSVYADDILPPLFSLVLLFRRRRIFA